MKTRKYTQKVRARQQEETRARIVEATMALHEELGPRAANVSAIAQRAGVQRLTVYRHFPDDADLFAACTGRWLKEHPPPRPAGWAHIADPGLRIRTALEAVYGYYRDTGRMWAVSYRDRDQVPALEGPMAGFEAHLDAVADDLLAAAEPSSSAHEAVQATLRHALAFQTWASLDDQGLSDETMAELVVLWLDGAAERPATAKSLRFG